MKEIEYKVLGVDDLELLVELRIKDLKMFSNQKITHSTIENIRVFYKEKMLKDECHTLVGYHLNQIISTATIYYYDILPSNENPKGKVGQITNVWIDENYRHLGIGRYMVEYLIENYQKDVGMIVWIVQKREWTCIYILDLKRKIIIWFIRMGSVK